MRLTTDSQYPYNLISFLANSFLLRSAHTSFKMKEFSLVASFVAPSLRQQSKRFASLPLRKVFDGSGAFSRRDSVVLGAETLDSSFGSSALQQQAPAGVYEAVLPQTETLVGMGFIVVLCVVLYWVWENQVVPVSRTKLAISKSRGEVKEYLDELKASSPSSSVFTIEPNGAASSGLLSTETAAAQQIAEKAASLQTVTAVVEPEEETTENKPVSPSQAITGDDRAFERWLFTDWLLDNKSAKKGGRQKEPALPILKSAKWNSGDNPVVVAAFLMMVGLVFTALTERMTSLG